MVKVIMSVIIAFPRAWHLFFNISSGYCMCFKSKLRNVSNRLNHFFKIFLQPCLFPLGHFYSPIPDIKDIEARKDKIWTTDKKMSGIEWNESNQLKLLQSGFKPYVSEISFPIKQQKNTAIYFYQNDQFPALDAEVLVCVLRHFSPKNVIEIGSGFSSLVTAHVNREYFYGALNFSCIEPYPREFLKTGVEGITQLVVEKVEDVSLDYFKNLSAGDILFIDSSHVSKVGSDVNHLFFEVIPLLKPGVLIHIHDIFLPDEYPKKWVIDEGRHWNEQYLVRAFLQFNTDFEIVWSSYFMAKYHSEEVSEIFPRFPELGGGGSLWLRRIDQ